MGAVVAAGIAGAVALSQGVLAYRGNPDQTGPNYTPERHEQMQKLMLEKKYDEANQIRKELGLGQGNGQGMGRGTRQGRSGANFVDKNGDGVCDNRQ